MDHSSQQADDHRHRHLNLPKIARVSTLPGMIVAGVDEAGYGPLLGPLVVGCCAMELPDAGDLDVESPYPCAWKLLRKHVSRTRSKTGTKLHVNDSKQVYSPSAGLKELEKSVLTLALCWGKSGKKRETASLGTDSLDELFSDVSPHVLNDLEEHPWYARGELPFPMECDGLNLRMLANAVSIDMERVGVRVMHLGARVVLEKQLNTLFKMTGNKSSTLFSTAAIHLDTLIRAYSPKNLTIFCDKHGGRDHYGALLRLMFEDWHLEIERESGERSDYVLHPKGKLVFNGTPALPVKITFCEKAESQSMSVAIASMLSKYLRECLMHRFNAFWRRHLPTVAPTAGYYTDGSRFLRDIQAKRDELGIPDADFVRSR